MSDVIETHTLYTAGAESLDVTERITPDPTAATPQFGVATAADTPPSSWVNGAWKAGSTWSSTTGQIVATSPTIGGTASLVITAGSTFQIWTKVVVGSETFIRRAATIVCPA